MKIKDLAQCLILDNQATFQQLLLQPLIVSLMVS